jgi:hypothetical protein
MFETDIEMHPVIRWVRETSEIVKRQRHRRMFEVFWLRWEIGQWRKLERRVIITHIVKLESKDSRSENLPRWAQSRAIS